MRISSLNNHKSIVIAVGVFISFVFVGVWNSLTSSGGGNSTIYVTEGNIFRMCFNEPFERLVLLMKDGNSITYTTQHEYCVHVSFGYIRHSIKKRGYETSDIIFCIHNHLVSPRFSQKDKDFCRHMRDDGFTGIFAIYHRPSSRVIIYEN